MKIGDKLPVAPAVGSNYYTDNAGVIWIEIGDPNDPNGVYAADGITGTLVRDGLSLSVIVDEVEHDNSNSTRSVR